jgi:hypothetical protein
MCGEVCDGGFDAFLVDRGGFFAFFGEEEGREERDVGVG